MEKQVLKEALDEHKKEIVEVVEKHIDESIPEQVSAQVKAVVQKMELQRKATGRDLTGLSKEKKLEFAEFAKMVAIHHKAGNSLIPESGPRGGYVAPEGVYDAILRIAEEFGVVSHYAAKFEMQKYTQMGIPSYTGAVLEGSYLDVDGQGDVSNVGLGQAMLNRKTWQLAFVINNTLLSVAGEKLADFVLALVAEALANKIDRQAFVGTGAPFVGVLNSEKVATYVMSAGKTSFDKFDTKEAKKMMGAVPKAIRAKGAWFMSYDMWAEISTQTDAAGQPVLPQGGAPSNRLLAQYPDATGIKPDGELQGKPVFTLDSMPDMNDSAVETDFIVFGSIADGLAIGLGETLSVNRHESGTFDGKEIALSNQQALVAKEDHALVVSNPKAFVKGRTAAA